MNYLKMFFMNGTKTAGRITHAFYILLRVIVTVMLVDQIFQQNMGNTFLLLLTLVLFEIPYLLENVKDRNPEYVRNHYYFIYF